MANVTEHYAKHLAPVYLWMAGGLDHALARGDSEIAALCPAPAADLLAVDLGAGFGMHAVPLARRGYRVIAIDTSSWLLDALREQSTALPIRCIEDDLLGFAHHLSSKADLILCMGDTLTHLPDQGAVEQLFEAAAATLQPGGRFIASFRDYTHTLTGEKRFIPVRSDATRILTCFLEYAGDHVLVHDILHELHAGQWQQHISAYPKLRLAPAWVEAALQHRGFTAQREPGLGGMVRIIAMRH